MFVSRRIVNLVLFTTLLTLVSMQNIGKATEIPFHIDVSSLTVNPYNPSNHHSVSVNKWYANAFVTHNGPGFEAEVDEIKLALKLNQAIDATKLYVQIYSNAGVNHVGNALAGGQFFLNDDPNSITPDADGVYTLRYDTNNGGVKLAGGTKYWLVVGSTDSTLSGTGQNRVDWLKTNPQADVVGDGATILRDIEKSTQIWESGDSGQSWVVCWTPDQGNQMMRFAISTPEPSTYILGSIIAAVLAFTARSPRFRKLHEKQLATSPADY